MSKATNAVMFLTGAACGAAIAWHYAKKKYEQIAQEEIDSVKEAFQKREADADTVQKEQRAVNLQKIPEKPDISEYASILHNHGYSEEVVSKLGSDPYVISPEEFGAIDDYEQISLSYYADQILADENDELVEDIENVVGVESLTHFGEYEDDSVFVRNDRLRCDYEILMDTRNYSDVIKTRPHPTEV